MTSAKKDSSPWRNGAILAAAVILGAFQIYTSVFGLLTPMYQRSIHLALVCLIVFLLKPSRYPALDVALAIIGLIPAAYLIRIMPDYIYRAGEVLPLDRVAFIILLVVLLEATRRCIGWSLVIIALAFLVYSYAGPFLPGILGHRGYSLDRLVVNQLLSMSGVFGSPLGAAATFVYAFILFGAFLNASGAGKVFLELSYAIAGRFRGGPGKIAVVASALFGTISGAPVANVTTTGAFTIPLMKQVGYRPEVAGAIEAVASTGGSIMPPVMGAAAFIMAEITGIPYYAICLAAAIPAVLYYISVYFSIDLEAGRTGLKGLPASELPSLKRALRSSLLFLVPFSVLVYLLVVSKVTPLRAGMWSIVAVIATNLVLSKEKLGVAALAKTLRSAANGTTTVTLATATAGIVIGIIGQTGFGLKLTDILVTLGHDSTILLLVLTAAAGVILGMGLPVSASYIVLAAVGAPALVKAGFSLIAAHMFIMYFASLAPITPPVALASFAAAGLAGTDPNRTSYTACRFGLSAFLVPFIFMYSPQLLAQGAWQQILYAGLTATVGVFAMSCSTIGWAMGSNLAAWQRLLTFVGALLLIQYGLVTDIAGIVLVVVALGWSRFTTGRSGYETAAS